MACPKKYLDGCIEEVLIMQVAIPQEMIELQVKLAWMFIKSKQRSDCLPKIIKDFENTQASTRKVIKFYTVS